MESAMEEADMSCLLIKRRRFYFTTSMLQNAAKWHQAFFYKHIFSKLK
jgi:hypothetical protein